MYELLVEVINLPWPMGLLIVLGIGMWVTYCCSLIGGNE